MKNVLRPIIALLLLNHLVFGCTCLPSENATQELKQSAAVFSGKVLEVKRNDQAAGSFTSVEIVLEVDRVWKGIEKNRLSVFTSSQPSACGYAFKKDETYLVFASRNVTGQLITSICSRTKRIKAAESDLQELGQGKALPIEKSN